MKFELTENQAQQVLDALADKPYRQVYDLINLIQMQASEQMQDKAIDG